MGLAPAPARLPRRDEGRRPRGDPARAAEALRRGAAEAARYPGLKEEYYLADFEPDPGLPDALGVDPARVLVVLRTPPDVSLYHRHANPLFPQTLDRLGRGEAVHAVVLPRTDEQREYVRSLGLPSVLVPERAVDAQSLIAAADLVVSAGGTMNREAVALGVPVYTTFGGRLGAVDEALIREGRLKPLSDPARARAAQARARRRRARVRRDPQDLLDLLLSAARASAASTAVAVALQLRRADAGHGGELVQGARLPRRDLLERRVVEDDVGGHLVGAGALEAPGLRAATSGRVRLARLRASTRKRGARPRARRGSGSAFPTSSA